MQVADDSQIEGLTLVKAPTFNAKSTIQSNRNNSRNRVGSKAATQFNAYKTIFGHRPKNLKGLSFNHKKNRHQAM